MHDTRTVAITHVIGQIQGTEALVAVFACAVVHVIQRVAEHLAAQYFTFGFGQHGAFYTEALQRFFYQIGGQQQHATRGVHQRVFQLGVGVQCLVGRNSPRGGGPDHDEGLLASGHAVQAKGFSQAIGIVGFKRHV